MSDIVVLNVGSDAQFKHAMRQVAGIVGAFDQRRTRASFEAHTSRYAITIAQVLARPAGLLHVMGHGTRSGRIAAGSAHRVRRPQRDYDVDQLRDWIELSEQDLVVDGLLLDGCDTFSATWQRKTASLFPEGTPVVVIGTTRSVFWEEASTYVGGFYAALLRTNFPTSHSARREAIWAAHVRATAAYWEVWGKTAPFEGDEILGTRR